MYAVIKTGGKQYRRCSRSTLKVESLHAEVGQQVKLSEVRARWWTAPTSGPACLASRGRKLLPQSYGTDGMTKSRFSRCNGASTSRSTPAIGRISLSCESTRSQPDQSNV